MSEQSQVHSLSAGQWHGYSAEVKGLQFELLDDRVSLLGLLTPICQRFDPTSRAQQHRQFQPQGVSAVLAGTSLRLVLHTWPELGVVTLDLSATAALATTLLSDCLTALREGGGCGGD